MLFATPARYAIAAVFLAASVWSAFLYAEAADEARLALMTRSEAAPIIAAPPPDDASARWLDAYSARLADMETSGAHLRALTAARRAVVRDPSLIASWNRIAWLGLSLFGRLTGEGRAALAAGLALIPFGPPELMFWRLRFADTVWDDMPADMRMLMHGQIVALARSPAWRGQLRRMGERECSNDAFKALIRAETRGKAPSFP